MKPAVRTLGLLLSLIGAAAAALGGLIVMAIHHLTASGGRR